MMTYDEFKANVSTDVLNYLPGGADEWIAGVKPIRKTNQILDGLLILRTNQETEKVACPIIYLEQCYKYIKEGAHSYENVLESIADGYLKELKAHEQIVDKADICKESASDHLFCTVINVEKNEKLLACTPHQIKHGLAIICKWLFSKDEDGLVTALVNEGIMKEQLNMDEDEMFSLAMKNTKRMFPTKICPICVSVEKTLERMGMPKEMIKKAVKEITPENDMFVVSNDIGQNGAINFLYDETLLRLSDIMKGNFYILPSSIHEVIAVRDPNKYTGYSEQVARNMLETVMEVNKTEVSAPDFLSDSVYYYEWLSEKMTIKKASTQQ
ncbi:MAG: hypothetical protein K0R00_21 [Herbinix sp.]|jgi:hypothetical protein|nr:hypothetical protein [Herbinix sp.]